MSRVRMLHLMKIYSSPLWLFKYFNVAFLYIRVSSIFNQLMTVSEYSGTSL